MPVAHYQDIAALACELGAAGADVPVATDIMLLPAGPNIQTRAHDGRKFKMSDASKVIAATKPILPFVIDYEHQSVHAQKNGQPAPAAGWVNALFEKAGAIYATVKWTERAAAMLKAGEYRFISPVFQIDQKTGDVLRLTAAALVADPAISMPALAAAQTAQEEIAMDLQMRLIKLLSLPPEADEAAVLAAISQLKNDGEKNTEEAMTQSSLAALTPTHPSTMATQLGQLEAQVQQLAEVTQTAAAKSCVDAAISGGKLTPAQRPWALQYAAKEPTAFEQFIACQPQILASGGTAAPPTIDTPLTSAEQQVCKAMGLTAKQFQAHNTQEQIL